jgi:hypothetical protein
LFGQLQGFLLLNRRFLRVHLLGRFDTSFRKKLLRLAARLSARAVVAPI